MKHIVLAFLFFLLRSDSYVVKITSLSFTSGQAHFSPRFYKDGIMFTKSRFGSKLGEENSDLYFSKIIIEERLGKPSKVKIKGFAGLNVGAHDFLAKTNEVFLSLPNAFEDETNDVVSIAICEGRLEGGSIQDLEILSFCKPGVTYCHPTISDDGKELIFVSNLNAEKMQLFHSMRNTVDDDWSEPGIIEELKTSETCLFPTLLNDSLLVFSSNMPGGKGGYDFYTCRKENGTWTKPVNWVELNSKGDEVCLDMVDENSGYFASDRDNTGGDRIYFFKK
ncbi:MAG: hypothetical protein IT258_13990 [Saprospiraceae bacterium]|nr:hypothetical protein [Saprospiraceae bacterium]